MAALPPDDDYALQMQEEILKKIVWPFIYYGELMSRSVELLEDSANHIGAPVDSGTPLVASVSQAKDVALGAVILAAKDRETQARINHRLAELHGRPIVMTGQIWLRMPDGKKYPISINDPYTMLHDSENRPFTITAGPFQCIPEQRQMTYYGKPYFNIEGAIGRTAKISISGSADMQASQAREQRQQESQGARTGTSTGFEKRSTKSHRSVAPVQSGR